MAIVHSTSKAGSGRNRRKRSGGRSRISEAGQKSLAHTDSGAQNPAGIRRSIRIPARLRVFLGAERDAVIEVRSLLVCIGQAIEFEHPAKGPYYPDIVGLAADILRRRVVNMDELLLDGLLPVGLDQGGRGD